MYLFNDDIHIISEQGYKYIIYIQTAKLMFVCLINCWCSLKWRVVYSRSESDMIYRKLGHLLEFHGS